MFTRFSTVPTQGPFVCLGNDPDSRYLVNPETGAYAKRCDRTRQCVEPMPVMTRRGQVIAWNTQPY